MFTKKIRNALCVSALAICTAMPASFAQAQIISNPDDNAIQSIAAFLAGNTPNFREDALKSYEYRNANEFDKPQVLTDVETRLRNAYEGLANLEGLQLRVGGDIGEYDAAAGVYRISVFDAGVYFPFRAGYRLNLDNASAFHEWELPVAEARKIRELTPSGAVTVEIVAIPFGTGPSDQRHVRAQVVSMKLFERRTGQLLHEVVIPNDQHRTIQSAGAQKPSQVDNDQLVLADLRLGMSIDDAKAVLTKAGYSIGEELGLSFRFSTYEDGLKAQIGSMFIAPSAEETRFPHADHFDLGPVAV